MFVNYTRNNQNKTKKIKFKRSNLMKHLRVHTVFNK